MKQDLLVSINEEIVNDLKSEITKMINDKVKEVTKA